MTMTAGTSSEIYGDIYWSDESREWGYNFRCRGYNFTALLRHDHPNPAECINPSRGITYLCDQNWKRVDVASSMPLRVFRVARAAALTKFAGLAEARAERFVEAMHASDDLRDHVLMARVRVVNVNEYTKGVEL
jgi:hypothetical protein